ncbi:MAG: hypothetical protein ACKO2K_19055 [Alphaproteobacteria bacterium]
MRPTWILGAVLLLASALADASFAKADEAFALDDSPRLAVGRVTRIDGQTVEVGGRTGVLGEGSDVRSDGRAVSAASIRVGMEAQMEVDVRGRILEIRVVGVAE